jgi:hypothetical protein
LTITVFQAFTFYASEDKLVNRGHYAGEKIGVEAINRYVIVLYIFYTYGLVVTNKYYADRLVLERL